MREIKITKSGEYRVEIDKPGDEVQITGMFHGQNDDDININLTIVHSAPHTRAKTMLKGVAQDRSKIRFFGRIVIEENCGDTQSFLEERILLLSDQAKAEAVPELEIKTDDVKCSHAASISRIPEEHLFYLESRGIPPKKAEAMVVEGFLNF
ncbi:MAG TPA: SufD family Fe-S cluster assembly protein [Patescibacteria group bacterium]|nr:SufD family Fe-S cluster assembly protein [Patescibacteria group bacterium]